MRAVLSRIRGWLQAIPLEYRLLCALFVGSRLALRAIGLQYSLQLDWMFLDDPARLQHHLLDSLLSFHVYPPGMNLLTGLLLKLSPQGIVAWAQILYAAAGLLLSASLLYLLRAMGLSRAWALGISVAFGLTPPALYFENLYIYTYPVATLVCAGGACLHRALQTGSRAAYSLFFLCAAVLGLIRSTFHISWFFALLVLTLLLCGRARMLRVLACALLPLLLLLSLYLKNHVRFGSFGATSAGGGNLTLVTVARMPKDLRDQWVREGKLSPMAKISVYAPPRAYLKHFGPAKSKRWPELSPLEHSTGSPNYNHWFFMEANRLRTADALTVLKARPGAYARTVLRGLQQIFEPSTGWHPHAGKPEDPHYVHEQTLGRYTAIYNRVVHGLPRAPVGLYWLLPLVLAFALYRVWQLRASIWAPGHAPPSTPDGTPDRMPDGAPAHTIAGARRAELGVLLYAGFQIVFVVLTSSLFTIGESARYRVQIEAMIWLLGAYAALALARRVRRFVLRGALPAGQEPG